MMRGVSTWAVAVRKPLPEQLAEHGLDPEEAARGEIEVRSFPLTSVLKRHRAAAPADRPRRRRARRVARHRLQGARHLRQRAAARGRGGDLGRHVGRHDRASRSRSRSGCSSSSRSALTSLIKDQLGSSFLLLARRGPRCAPRSSSATCVLLSRLRDLRRVFEYHGAEHKTISCYEAGLELTPENAQRFSRLHPRCGTSFLLIVMIVAIFVFAPIGLPAWYWLVLTRIVGVPLIAGISFEIIKFAGRNRRRALGADGHVAGPAAPAAHHPRARPRPARRRDRRDGGRARRGEARRRLRRRTWSAIEVVA